MREIHVNKLIDASSDSVWSVLADFPNIADWNGGVKKSFSTSTEVQGVGATRHCDLSPAGTLEETIREWQEKEKLVISIDSATKLPIRRGVATFELTAKTAEATDVHVNYEYATKWGIFGQLMGGVLDKQLAKGFRGFLDDLATASTAA